MHNKGIIKNIENNFITINFYKSTACSHCSSCSEKNKFGITISIDKPANFNKNIGDEINLEIEDRILLKLSFITYIFPALFMILGYFVSTFLGGTQGISIISSFSFLIISFFCLFFYDKKRSKYIKNDFLLLD